MSSESGGTDGAGGSHRRVFAPVVVKRMRGRVLGVTGERQCGGDFRGTESGGQERDGSGGCALREAGRRTHASRLMLVLLRGERRVTLSS